MSMTRQILLVLVSVVTGAGIGPRGLGPTLTITVDRAAAEPNRQPAHPAASHRLPAVSPSPRLPAGNRAPDGGPSMVAAGPFPAVHGSLGSAAPSRHLTVDRRAQPTHLQFYPTAPSSRT